MKGVCMTYHVESEKSIQFDEHVQIAKDHKYRQQEKVHWETNEVTPSFHSLARGPDGPESCLGGQIIWTKPPQTNVPKQRPLRHGRLKDSVRTPWMLPLS